jgi:hypothetical protein
VGFAAREMVTHGCRAQIADRETFGDIIGYQLSAISYQLLAVVPSCRLTTDS